jgi:methylthioribose-1-phosphate isomerase
VRGRLVGSLAQAVVQVTPDLDLEGGGVYNPSFDVTPAGLISAIVTERGVAERVQGSGSGSDEAIDVGSVA